MYDNRALNRQLFIFIVFFGFFAFLVGQFVKFPEVSGAPKDEWDYIAGLNFFTDDIRWQPADGDIYVTRSEAAQLFQAVEDNKDNLQSYIRMLVQSGVFSDNNNFADALMRDELYRFVAKLLDPRHTWEGEEYFLGAGKEMPLDLYARLGVIEVPYDRMYLPLEPVSRQETVGVLARASLPALRVNNAPVIIQPRQRYTYDRLTADLQRLTASYPELLELHVIGESVEGRKIYAVRLGQGKTEVFIDASIHASEWLTTPLVMKMLEEYTHHASFDFPYGGYNLTLLLEQVSFWFIPMLNPDGVTFVLEGSHAVENGSLARQIRANQNGALDFTDWKANIRGVDLNRQFPTGWQGMVNTKKTPAPSHYKGSKPLSEPEAQALYEFTLERNPAIVLSYHQRGEIIFWYYRQRGAQLERDRRIVQALAALTGYKYDFYLTNGGKYRDWAIQELGIPALIMEVGQQIGDLSEWERIWRQNRYVGLVAAELILQELEKN